MKILLYLLVASVSLRNSTIVAGMAMKVTEDKEHCFSVGRILAFLLCFPWNEIMIIPFSTACSISPLSKEGFLIIQNK